MVKRQIVFLAAVFLLVFLFGCGGVEPHNTAYLIKDVSPPDAAGYYTCNYNGVERKFMLYIPETAEENAPLVFLLHGYSSNSKSFMDYTGMNNVAQRYGYAVVYPQGIRDPANSVGGTSWNSGLSSTGNDDAGFLVSLAHYLQQTHGFHSRQTFAAGFSNGAFMMYRLATQAPDTFRAVASVAGSMSGGAWDERSVSASVGILQINGTKDDLVPISGLSPAGRRYGNAPTIDGVIEYWKDANGLDEFEESKLSATATAYRYWDKSNNNLVWYIEIEDGHHSWPQEDIAGFNTNEVILDFFSNYVD